MVDQDSGSRSPPPWLVRVLSGLSNTTARDCTKYECQVKAVEECQITDVLRVTNYGRGGSIRFTLQVHRSLARLGLIPFANTINHGKLLCENQGRRKTPRIWFYDALEAPIEWDGFTYHRPWMESLLHPILNAREVCEMLDEAARARRRSMG